MLAALLLGYLQVSLLPSSHEDWLLESTGHRAIVTQNGHSITLTNGLVSQTFQIQPNLGTVAIDNLMTGESLLRATGPEAVIEIDGHSIPVGGLQGQPDRGFLFDAWKQQLKGIDGALKFKSFSVSTPQALVPWIRNRRSAPSEWPPKGRALNLTFEGGGLRAVVEYQLFDGIPLIGKRVTVINLRQSSVMVTGVQTERLDLTEVDSDPQPGEWRLPSVSVLTDYRFCGMDGRPEFRTTAWQTDPGYTSQVSYDLQTPCRLSVRVPLGPNISLKPLGSLTTFNTYMLVHDSTDRERQGLATRKLYRLLAPWTTESPIMLHLTSTDPAVVRKAIDQASEVGFEMVIFSFGSGLDMEDVSPRNLERFRAFADYAHSKGLQIGGYSLLASRSIDPENDVIDPKTLKPGGAVFGSSPCLGSKWAKTYFEHLKTFLVTTGFDLLEHDGSYPGDVCASTQHPGHKGLADSQWTQFQTIAAFYRWCRAQGIFLNVPDNYFLTGSNKTGMGYREDNWSLPREQQHIHARQNLFDGTWLKPPTMGWMFTPLVEYHGGGSAATIEPLKEHLQDYALHLMNNLGYGVQSCYRGSRLYDSPETKSMVSHWVSWFKGHRSILESDVIHVKRADGRNLDTVLHVNPGLPTRAMAVIYNPLSRALTQKVELPLYYSGLTGSAIMRLNDGPAKRIRLTENRTCDVEASVPPKACIWVTFSKG